MEPKKTPEADIHRKRGVIFNLSLATSLIVVICAFNVAVKVHQPKPRPTENPDDVTDIYVPVTVHTPPSQRIGEQPKKTARSAGVEFRPVETTSLTSASAEMFDVEALPAEGIGPIGDVELPKEPYDSVFLIVEAMPEPVGGYKNMMRTLSEQVKYPAKAKRTGVAGKVFVQFIVNEKGEPVDFNVIAGIGGGCDEEAVRALSKIKWHAGKQRGRAVKVRMVQPVTFSLSE